MHQKCIMFFEHFRIFFKKNQQNFVTHHLSPHHLSHTTLSHTIFHTQLCHTLSFTHNFHTHHISHTALSHTYTPSSFVTHHLSHSTLSHTTVLTFRSFTTSFAFPSFSVPATTFGAHYWKKLPCGVIRSFNSWFAGFAEFRCLRGCRRCRGMVGS